LKFETINIARLRIRAWLLLETSRCMRGVALAASVDLKVSVELCGDERDKISQSTIAA
jgi:hypothetical protein